ncbi:MAG TPA: DUF4339 domain-containing protein [Gemmataceae bacterium]|jgi:hypothetical protein|nr:DUF4339 domain-containing protein [Gemmataceae bacterium]
MTNLWYFWRDTDVRGPFSAEEFAALATSGELVPSDTVWAGDDERGRPAHRVLNLFPANPHTSQVAVEMTEAQPALVATGEVAAAPPPERAVAPGWDAGRSQPPPGRARATAGKGAVIVGQDGKSVKFRKKCTTCGHEDSSWKTIPIPRGSTRVAFYCPKCRKPRQVEIYGSSS